MFSALIQHFTLAILVYLAGLGHCSPVPQKTLTPKTKAHCCADRLIRDLIYQILPYSRTLSKNVYIATKSLVSLHKTLHSKKHHKLHVVKNQVSCTVYSLVINNVMKK